MMPQRLYIVVDGSMPASTFAPQACHALTGFALGDPDGFKTWHDDGNICIVLAEGDGKALARRAVEASRLGFSTFVFFEEDWAGGTPSAVCFAPHEDLRAWLNDLPTAKPGGFFAERRRVRNLRRRWARP